MILKTGNARMALLFRVVVAIVVVVVVVVGKAPTIHAHSQGLVEASLCFVQRCPFLFVVAPRPLC